MRAAAIAAAVVAAFVGVMYLRFSNDSVPGPPPGVVAGGPQCVVFRNVSGGDNDADAQATCGPTIESPAAPVSPVRAGPTAQPTPAAPPDSIGGVTVESLTVGPEIEFSRQVALIVVTGCECDIPPTGLTRVYRDGAGSLRTDELFTPEKVGLPPHSAQTNSNEQQVRPWITAFAAAQDASQLFVEVCARGDCRNPQDSTAEQRLYRSHDGGVTWEELGNLGPGTYLTKVLKDGEVLVSSYPPSTIKPPPPAEYRYYPSGEAVAPPTGATAYWRPVLLPEDEIGWETEDGRLLRNDGSSYFHPGPPWSRSDSAVSISSLLNNSGARESLVVIYDVRLPVDQGGGYLLGLDRAGAVTRAYRTPVYMQLGAWPDFGQGLATANFCAARSDAERQACPSYLPSVIDLRSRLIQPIRHPFVDSPLNNSVREILSAQRGSFARVVNTDNTCLNIHSAPALDAPILNCAAEGVLLVLGIGTAEYPNVVDVDGTQWWSVIAPSGTEGFASGNYLER